MARGFRQLEGKEASLMLRGPAKRAPQRKPGEQAENKAETGGLAGFLF
jgi:hypothetical protein